MNEGWMMKDDEECWWMMMDDDFKLLRLRIDLYLYSFLWGGENLESI